VTAACPQPQVWLTEQGVYKRQFSSTTNKTRFFTTAEVNRNTRFLLDHVATHDSRTTRFYYYSMRGAGDFDTGLESYVSPYKHRQSYNIVKARYNR
jgi:hypothetical protein